MKENFILFIGDICLFSIGLFIVVIFIFLSYLVIFFGDYFVLVDFSIGVFFWIVILSIVFVGFFMLGYGLNNKYFFLGGLWVVV